MRHIGADELRALVPLLDAVDVLARVFGERPPATAQRTVIHAGAGDLLLMPALGAAVVGVKLVTVAPGNPARGLPAVQGVYALFSADELRPLATIDGAALTLLRTAAVSALAARLLASPTASRLVLFGAGPQADAHLEAMAAVRPLRSVSVVSRGLERARILVESAGRRGLDASLGIPADVAGSELVCTCTTSPTPVFDGSLVAPGTHVSAVGAYTPQTRELDEQLVSRATVVVETREAALAEAGDLLMPIASGSLTADRVHELADVVTGRVGRRTTHEVTLFKSVGVAFEDLAVAEAAFSRSR